MQKEIERQLEKQTEKMRCIDREKEKERQISRDKDIELERKGKRIKQKELYNILCTYIAIFCISFHAKLSFR